MKSSPHKPLILKRRKLPLCHGDTPGTLAGEDSPRQGNVCLRQQPARTDEHSTNRKTPAAQKLPAELKIISHPAMANTSVVAIPAGTDVQSVVEALAAKGKEWGSNGPNKFILINSGSGFPSVEAREFNQLFKSDDEHSFPCNKEQGEEDAGPSSGATKGMAFWASESQSVEEQEQEENSSGEAPSCSLDNSLTNIQWLGKMSSDGLSPCSVKKETEKENQTPKPEAAVKTEESPAAPLPSNAPWPESFLERPPYSYMAMIQFAINSTEKKRLTLKDIYTWIEDHFPYFKHVAKPGWKNSIRHNLSLHDMFVRETAANGKISFWTIHPEANRYLTLDQVFKSLDARSPPYLKLLASQQKRHTPDLLKNPSNIVGSRTEPKPARRKMKPLLPRVNSYLVPIQFPLSQSLILQPSAKIPLPVSQSMSEPAQSSKRVLPTSVKPTAVFPEISIKEEEEVYCEEESSSLLASHQSCQSSRAPFPAVLSVKKERDLFSASEWNASSQPSLPTEETPVQDDEELDVFLPGPESQKRQLAALRQPSQEMLHTKRHKWHENSRSRRKQRLALPCLEDPALLLPANRGSEPLSPERPFPPGRDGPPPRSVSCLNCCSPGECGPLKTPAQGIFCTLPASSALGKTPPSAPSLMAADSWSLVPLAKEAGAQDFSPRRSPPVPLLSFQDRAGQEDLDLSTSLLRPFDSPQPLLRNTDADDGTALGPLISSSASPGQSPPEFQASLLPENGSLQEGLVLDTMNDSLSKILLEISFPGLDEDSLETDLSWSQLIPDLK